MSFPNLARNYLRSLFKTFEAIKAGGGTAELSFRPALHDFFSGLANEIGGDHVGSIFEPNSQHRAGRPDWRFFDKASLGVYGFIEAKAFDPKNQIDPGKNAVQIARYLELKQNLVLTDGIDFVFYWAEEDRTQPISLLSKPLAPNGWDSEEANGQLETAFRKFFASPRPRKVTEAQLVREVALRARRMAIEVADVAATPPGQALNAAEKDVITKLNDLKNFLRENHDPSLSEPRPFADFVAQVLCFGLLYSHRCVDSQATSPSDRYNRIHRFWLDGLSGTVAPLKPFRELVSTLKESLEPEEGRESPLSTWYDDTRLLLSYVELTTQQISAPDFHRLYEVFLQKFDPQTKYDFGAFYTPRELADFTVAVVEQAAKEFFGTSLHKKGNKLIDPCCGTGTFLELLVERLGLKNEAHIVGFEILPAPYALAHYRLNLLSKQLPAAATVSVLLTNTLSDRLEMPPSSSGSPNGFEQEQDEARRFANPPIIAILGNPPSSDSSMAAHQQAKIYNGITKLVDDFRPPLEKRSARQNTQKQLRNDFVRFLRWSVAKAKESARAVVALIVPESFLEHSSYRFARKWLIENFSLIYCLDIDADQRRSGLVTDSLFETLQGRALLLLIRKTDKSNESASVRYGTIRERSAAGKRQFLLGSLNKPNLGELFPQTVKDNEIFSFRPGAAYKRELWERCWPLYSGSPTSDLPVGQHAIFIRHTSGLKLGATSLLVHASSPILQRRTKELSKQNVTFSKLKQDWFSGQRKLPTERKLHALKDVFGKAPKDEPYLLRPFVTLRALLDDAVLTSLSDMEGGGARTRPEVRKAFTKKPLAFTVAPSRKDIGEDLHRFVSFAWNIPDNDLCTRGNSQVLCEMFPEYKRLGKTWDPQPKQNLDESLLRRVPDVNGINRELSVVYYSFALLCSRAYLEQFAGALFTTASAESIPRIPFTSDALFYSALARSGKRLAELENPAYTCDLGEERKALLHSFKEADGIHLNGLRKWSNGGGQIDLQLIDKANNVLFTLPGIDPGVAGFRVSGYVVIDEWVKWQSHPYTRLSFTKETIKSFIELICRIELQILELDSIDNTVEAVMASPKTWLIPG